MTYQACLLALPLLTKQTRPLGVHSLAIFDPPLWPPVPHFAATLAHLGGRLQGLQADRRLPRLVATPQQTLASSWCSPLNDHIATSHLHIDAAHITTTSPLAGSIIIIAHFHPHHSNNPATRATGINFDNQLVLPRFHIVDSWPRVTPLRTAHGGKSRRWSGEPE